MPVCTNTRRVANHGSLVLDRPLTFAHPAGTRVMSLGFTIHDVDADGLTNTQENDLGTDPLVPNAFPSPSGGALSIRLTGNGRLEVRSPQTPRKELSSLPPRSENPSVS